MKRVVAMPGAAVCSLLLAACAVTGVGLGVDESVGFDYDAGFYEPYGYEYGGWGPGYRVGPPRGGERGPGPWPGSGLRPGDGGGSRGAQRPFRAPPAGRPMPSIPAGPRGPHR